MNAFRIKLHKIYYIVYKELLTTLKDPKNRIVLIIPVLIQGLLFGYTATYNLEHIPYAVLDESHSRESTELLAHLDGTGIYNRVATLQSTGQIARLIDSGDAMLVITIPPDFARKLNTGKTAPVQLITDGRNPTTAGLSSGYTTAVIAGYNAAYGGPPVLDIQSRTRYHPHQITRWMFLPSLIAMLALTQVMVLAGLSVARERENGTFDQLLVTPLTPMEILIGKLIPPVIIGLVQSSMMLSICVFWFKVPMVGSLPVLGLTVFIFLLSSVGIGLSISAVSKNMQQVMVYCFLFLLPMLLLSGLATPVQNMPEALQYATYINPTRFVIEAIRRIYLEGADLAAIAYTYPPMLIVAAVTMPAAAWLFRHKLS